MYEYSYTGNVTRIIPLYRKSFHAWVFTEVNKPSELKGRAAMKTSIFNFISCKIGHISRELVEIVNPSIISVRRVKSWSEFPITIGWNSESGWWALRALFFWIVQRMNSLSLFKKKLCHSFKRRALGSRHNRSLVIAPQPPKHASYWRGAPCKLYFPFSIVWFLKFLIIYWNLYNFIIFLLNVSFNWIRFWIIFYKIDIYPRSLFITSLGCALCCSLHLSCRRLLHLRCKVLLKLWAMWIMLYVVKLEWGIGMGVKMIRSRGLDCWMFSKNIWGDTHFMKLGHCNVCYICYKIHRNLTNRVVNMWIYETKKLVRRWDCWD